jgi:hypothetical protein
MIMALILVPFFGGLGGIAMIIRSKRIWLKLVGLLLSIACFWLLHDFIKETAGAM